VLSRGETGSGGIVIAIAGSRIVNEGTRPTDFSGSASTTLSGRSYLSGAVRTPGHERAQ
jgi:hypothetical protein